MWEGAIEKMDPEGLFSFTWLQFDRSRTPANPTDYSNSPELLWNFALNRFRSGTLLLLTESGFESIPADWRPEAFRRNDSGWTEQMKNIESHVTQNT